MIYWDSGTPYEGVSTTNNTGTTKYWHDGVSFVRVFEAIVTNPIKSVNQVTWANIKKIGGVAIANIKKIFGVSTT